MQKCSSCGYPIAGAKATPISYCRVCLAIGAPQINENPNAFGDSKYLIPPLAWCTNYIIDAISTRAEANESATPAGRKAFVVLSDDGQMVEVQDEYGKPIEMPTAQFAPVDGTTFKKFGVLLPLR